MTAFANFARRCRMRHDFADQFQVRYHHPNGEHYDTWVSGEEALSRLRSAGAEERCASWAGNPASGLRGKKPGAKPARDSWACATGSATG